MAGLKLTFSLKAGLSEYQREDTFGMQSHDQLHIVQICGTDHSRNSGYIYLTFLQAWTYPNQQGASGDNQKLYSNYLGHFLFLK